MGIAQQVCTQCSANLVFIQPSKTRKQRKAFAIVLFALFALLNCTIAAAIAQFTSRQVDKTNLAYESNRGDDAELSDAFLRSKDWTELHIAAARGNADTVAVLLQQGANIEARHSKNKTPLYEAAKRGHYEVVKLLIQHGTNVSSRNGDVGFSPLHAAAEYKHSDVMQLLLASGADVNSRNGWDQTPLHQVSMRAWHKDSEAARFLVDHGAKIEARDNRGFTALVIASGNGNMPVVALLLDRGADINARTNDGATALTQAAGHGHEQIVSLLVDRGADINIQANGYTALLYAESRGHHAIAELLRRSGAKDIRAAYDHLQRGYSFDRVGNYQRAIDEYNQAITIDPQSSDAYYNRGVAYRKLGDHDKALADFKKAIEIVPTKYEAYTNLDWILAQRREWDTIIAYWTKLIDQQPSNAAAYRERGGAYYQKGDLAHALEDATKSCELGDKEGGCRAVKIAKQRMGLL